MSHLNIPFFTEMDAHYSPRGTPVSSRRPSVEAGGRHTISSISSPTHSHLQLPLFTALDEHYSPRPSVSEARPAPASGMPSAAASPTLHAAKKHQLNLPVFSSLDNYYSPRASLDERRESNAVVATSVEPKAVHVQQTKSSMKTSGAAKKASSKSKKQDTFFQQIESFPWFSGSR